ncbi:Photosystem II 5 kDa protein [Hibiscus syriacus]|uniref:Photosystem II 5 kDa protein n=1 Tax=Hibiscus syriacus TaxID=106335 RepID=A0A6A3AB02_HIBSY|nr:Photosystem II 5 kDa protein [Hibiscus syriacus]
MASITMTAPFLSATNFTKGTPRIGQRRLVVVANAAKRDEVEGVQLSGGAYTLATCFSIHKLGTPKEEGPPLENSLFCSSKSSSCCSLLGCEGCDHHANC